MSRRHPGGDDAGHAMHQVAAERVRIVERLLDAVAELLPAGPAGWQARARPRPSRPGGMLNSTCSSPWSSSRVRRSAAGMLVGEQEFDRLEPGFRGRLEPVEERRVR